MSQNQSSGTSSPLLLPAPRLLPFGDGAIIKNIYSYVLRHHGAAGLSVLYYRKGGDICVQFGDWAGNPVDPHDSSNRLAPLAEQYLGRLNVPLCNLLHTIGVGQAQLFLNEELTLCDMQVSVNKLAGPGMLQNIFSNVVRTPEVVVIETIDQRAVDAILAGSGVYAGDLVLKPSRFRHYQLDSGKYTPLHVQIAR